MRVLILSDVHGVPSTLEQALLAGERLGYDKIALLGDLLYHGPRNGVPNFYDPMKVVELLNPLSERIVAVRGNCDAEVDQMLLKFPIQADYQVLEAGGERLFLTHGHLFNENRIPPLGIGTALVHGHTHVPEFKTLACGLKLFNPGSVSLPKGGSTRGFGYFDGETFRRYAL